jgi:hypothetical protein
MCVGLSLVLTVIAVTLDGFRVHDMFIMAHLVCNFQFAFICILMLGNMFYCEFLLNSTVKNFQLAC